MDVKYKCVMDIAELKAYIGDAKIVAFDYETAPDEAFRDDAKASLDPFRSHIVECSYSVAEGTAVAVSLKHLTGSNMDYDVWLAFHRELLMDIRRIKVCHNIAFESMVSYHLGIVIQAPVYDTMCAAQMTQNGEYSFRKLSESGLKTLSASLLGVKRKTFSETTDGKHFDELDPQDAVTIQYACEDSDQALQLYRIFNAWFDKYLPRHRWIVENLESPTAVYLGIMKHNGAPLDLPLMEKKKTEAESEMENLRQKIAFMIGDVNIGANCSTKAFKDYLYGTLGLPVLKTTLSNKEAADDQTMQMLKEWCDEKRPELSELFTLVQEYRKWGKIKSTYIDGYLKFLNPVTGCIHPDFFALSTDTGRFNCQHPNAQNMPRKTNDPIGVRNFIRAPEHHLIISLDFSQIELRVGAFYLSQSGDDTMKDVYMKNLDLHAKTTSVIFGVPYEQAHDKNSHGYKEHRTIAKNVNFGVFYGLFPRGLQKTLRFKAGIERLYEECADMIENLKTGYPGLSVWQEEVKEQAARRMYTETWIGRRRYLPNINSTDWGQKSFSERCAMNTPIQGTAADILKLAVARILAGLPERPWLRPILQIHDELTFIIPEDKLSEAVAFVKKCMEAKPFLEFDLPLIAEASAGPAFGSMEELDD